MKNFEFLRNVSIGMYVEQDSPIHRLSPAAKYLWLLALILPASFSSSVWVVGALAAVCLGFALLARIRPLVLLRGFLPVLPLLGLAAILQVLVTWPQDRSSVLLAAGPVSLTVREVLAVLAMALRFATLMLALGLFTSVITEGDTARGVEDLFAPLERFGFPARGLGLTVAVAFRFIPIVAGELETIVKAQAARGADLGSRRGGPVRRARAYLPLLVPVTIRALERAEALAEAMEARGWSSGPRTRYAESGGGRWDSLVKLAALVFAAAALGAEALLR